MKKLAMALAAALLLAGCAGGGAASSFGEGGFGSIPPVQQWQSHTAQVEGVSFTLLLPEGMRLDTAQQNIVHEASFAYGEILSDTWNPDPNHGEAPKVGYYFNAALWPNYTANADGSYTMPTENGEATYQEAATLSEYTWYAFEEYLVFTGSTRAAGGVAPTVTFLHKNGDLGFVFFCDAENRAVAKAFFEAVAAGVTIQK
ncbi:MAG: hypothetical protein ACK5L3_04210 [Oscillospiraceae bacterium]